MRYLTAAGLALALAVTLFFAGRCDGGTRERERAARALADTVAKLSVARADSVTAAVLEAQRSAAAAAAKIVAEADAKVAAERSRSDAASTRARATLADAKRLLADTAATVVELKDALRETGAELDSALARQVRERVAHDRAIAARDSANKANEAKWRLGLGDVQRGYKDALEDHRKATTAAVLAASGEGKRSGRIQGVVGTLVVEGLFVLAAVIAK